MYRSLFIGLGALLLLGACDASRFLSGKWVLKPGEQDEENPVDITALGCSALEGADCTKFIELNLGHFGAEVVGTMHFLNSLVTSDVTECKQCECRNFEAHYKNDVLSIPGFTDCKGANERTIIMTVDGNELVWELDSDTTIRFVRSDQLVTTRDKLCDECVTETQQ